jgi:hypothetical protein
MTWSGPPLLLSRPPVQNYIEFTRSQKVEFAQESLGMNALGRAGIELGEWQHLPQAEGKAALVL